MSKQKLITSWIARIVAAVIMGQTLFFKFSGAAEPIHIFSTLGAEPWGRYATGVFELIAAVLLLVPRTAAFGGLLTIGLMIGALGSHLFTPLGIVVKVPGQNGEPAVGDGGQLFIMGCIALVAGIITTVLHKDQILGLLKKK
ncbi:MAG: DoxX family protein [Phycisphaeraceae bacterium]|nr:DoxX family protein [Phycisphaeraceae bacterium]